MSEVVRMQLSKAELEEVDQLWSFLSELEHLGSIMRFGFKKPSQDDFEIFKFEEGDREDIEEKILNQIFAFVSEKSRYQCIMFNLDTLLRNCANPNNDVLEFKPAIANGLDLLEKVSDKVLAFDETDPVYWA
jgi:hypothetical protein